jgi:hypothetical protein
MDKYYRGGARIGPEIAWNPHIRLSQAEAESDAQRKMSKAGAVLGSVESWDRALGVTPPTRREQVYRWEVQRRRPRK